MTEDERQKFEQYVKVNFDNYTWTGATYIYKDYKGSNPYPQRASEVWLAAKAYGNSIGHTFTSNDDERLAFEQAYVVDRVYKFSADENRYVYANKPTPKGKEILPQHFLLIWLAARTQAVNEYIVQLQTATEKVRNATTRVASIIEARKQ